jgi:hypothetical protein
MNTNEKLLIIKWIINNVTDHVVPLDFENSDGLIFNLVHLAAGDKERWQYEDKQQLNVEEWVKSKGENLIGIIVK